MKMRQIAFLCMGLVCAWSGWYAWSYFFDTTKPRIALMGLHDGSYCAGDLTCIVTTDKTGFVSMWLDGKPVTRQFNAKASVGEYPFILPTTTLANGQHHLKVAFVDASFNKNTSIVECDFNVDNMPLQAAFVQQDPLYKVFQGRTLHVQLQTNKPIESAQVHVLSQSYTCYQESKGSNIYECFIPVACEEQPNEYLLSVDVTDNVRNTMHLDHKVQVVGYPFKKETLRVDAHTVQTAQSEGPSEKEFEKLMERVSIESPSEKLWRGTFCAPTDIQRVTCPFGTIRTTQHKGRYAHKALDVINHPKSVVWAPQDGVVVVKDRFAASGNTVVIDHGCGVMSMLFHLEDFANIEVGEKVAQGNPVGTLGKTGYATGYHLHWEMRVNNIPVDPLEWTQTTF